MTGSSNLGVVFNENLRLQLHQVDSYGWSFGPCPGSLHMRFIEIPLFGSFGCVYSYLDSLCLESQSTSENDTSTIKYLVLIGSCHSPFIVRYLKSHPSSTDSVSTYTLRSISIQLDSSTEQTCAETCTVFFAQDPRGEDGRHPRHLEARPASIHRWAASPTAESHCTQSPRKWEQNSP